MLNRTLGLIYKFMNNEQGFKLDPTQRLGVVYTLVSQLSPEDVADKETLIQLVRDLQNEEGQPRTAEMATLVSAAATPHCDRSSCGPCTSGGCHCGDNQPSTTELRPPELRKVMAPMVDAYRNINDIAQYFGCVAMIEFR